MKGLLIAPILVWCLLMTACESLEQQARDTAAALGGAIAAAQTQYQTACTATVRDSSTATACTLINKAVAAQNALVTADEAYCGFSPGTPLTTTCTPVKSAEAGLSAAISNATPFVTELKAIIQ
jgi:hypothetical protein